MDRVVSEDDTSLITALSAPAEGSSSLTIESLAHVTPPELRLNISEASQDTAFGQQTDAADHESVEVTGNLQPEFGQPAPSIHTESATEGTEDSRVIIAAGDGNHGSVIGVSDSILPLVCSCTVEAAPRTGVKSVCGRRPEMEDAVAVVHRFISLPRGCRCGTIPNYSDVSPVGSSSSGREVTGGPCEDESSQRDVFSDVHFFGVYDGHGGAQAANYCRENLHLALAEELRERMKIDEERPSERDDGAASSTSSSADAGASLVASSSNEASTSSSPLGTMSINHNMHHIESVWKEVWESAMHACFLRMDREVGSSSSGNEGNEQAAIGIASTSSSSSDTVGSTAVVAVLTCCQIIVANCGDSRAVLSRRGRAIALSVDHKPEREDELARIEAAGGRVICWNGYRVLGVLAMSRAIGDHFLKPFVIADPEVTCTPRSEDDDCLILASDGVWDVLSNDDVCKIARRCLSHHAHHHSHHHAVGTAAQTVASVLANTAHDRGSTDNISVVVVDLRKKTSSS